MFWDLFGEQGHPVRATISEMGPLLLSRLMDLNDVQEGVLNICFRVADEQGLLLLDLKDLRAMLGYISEHAAELTIAIRQRRRSRPSARSSGSCWCWRTRGRTNSSASRRWRCKDFIRTDRDGRGYINVLAADKLMENPRLYATFLLWLLSELFEELPEVGDLPKPKLCFFFDEAHLLFTDAPKALLDKIEQVVRLIRSKGVGVYFVTQNPLDVPDKVLAQLGNRVQHALRAFTPRDQKAVRAAAETFRANPKLDTAKVIMELGKGEALVSFLEGNGTPSMVERCMVRPPSARVGPITPEERKAIIAKSPVKGKYDQAIDSESAYEVLQKRVQETGSTSPPPPAPRPEATAQASTGGGLGGFMAGIGALLGGMFGTARPRGTRLSTGAGDRARGHPLGHQPGRRPDRRRSRQVAGRLDRRLGRSRHRARHARRHPAAVSCRRASAPQTEPWSTTIDAGGTPSMTPAQALPAVLDRIDADLDDSLARLFDFLKIQSISTDPAYKEQCGAAAEFIADDLAGIGFDDQHAADRRASGRGRQGPGERDGDAPRVLFYGHYDVQPVDPLDLWETPPFAPRIATLPDGRKIIVARGACDDKGPGDDLRRGVPRLQGGDRRAAAADHHDDRRRGGVRLEPSVRLRQGQRRRAPARSRAGLRHQHVGPGDADDDDLAARAGLRGGAGSPAPTAICIPACSAARRRTRCACWRASSPPCTTTTAASPFRASTTACSELPPDIKATSPASISRPRISSAASASRCRPARRTAC